MEYIEASVTATLTEMGPLTFGTLAKLVQEERRLVGYALVRLLSWGTVVIHDHRWVRDERGVSKLIPVYCLARKTVPPGSDVAATPGTVKDHAPEITEATCPACGRPRTDLGATAPGGSNPDQPTPRCAVCGEGLSRWGWCPTCAQGAVRCVNG
jgi:hypothetical protein